MALSQGIIKLYLLTYLLTFPDALKVEKENIVENGIKNKFQIIHPSQCLISHFQRYLRRLLELVLSIILMLIKFNIKVKSVFVQSYPLIWHY